MSPVRQQEPESPARSNWDYYTVWSPDDGEVSFVTGHVIPELTLGFEGDARLMRIMHATLHELRTSVGHRWNTTCRMGAYLALSDPFREQSGAALVADAEIQSEMESAKQADSLPVDDEPIRRQFTQAAQLADLPTQPVVTFISRQGQTATTQCVMQARADLDAGKFSQAIILACDSLLGETTLEWLENTGRLKSPAIPAGLAPSESGVAFLMETSSDEGDALARLGPTDLGHEQQSLLSGETVLGSGLAELLRQIDWSDGCPWLITDQNGEEYRAMEWGQALVRVIRDLPIMDESNAHLPGHRLWRYGGGERRYWRRHRSPCVSTRIRAEPARCRALVGRQ